MPPKYLVGVGNGRRCQFQKPTVPCVCMYSVKRSYFGIVCGIPAPDSSDMRRLGRKLAVPLRKVVLGKQIDIVEDEDVVSRGMLLASLDRVVKPNV